MEFEYNEEIVSGKSYMGTLVKDADDCSNNTAQAIIPKLQEDEGASTSCCTFQEQLSEEEEAARIRAYYEQKDRELFNMLFCPEPESEDDNDDEKLLFDMIPPVEGNLSFNFSSIKRNSLGEDDVGGFGVGCNLSPVKVKLGDNVTEGTFLTQSQYVDNNVTMGCDFSPIKASCNNEDKEDEGALTSCCTSQEQLSPEEEAARARAYYEQKDKELFKMLFCPEPDPENDNDDDEKMLFGMILPLEGNLSFNFSPIKRNSFGEDDVRGFGVGCDLSPVKDKPAESVTEANFMPQSQHVDKNFKMGCDFSPIKATCNNEDVEYTKFSHSIQGNSSVEMGNDDIDNCTPSSEEEEDDDEEGISFSESRKIIRKKFLSFFGNSSDETSNDTMYYSIIDMSTLEENDWNTLFNLTAYLSVIEDN